MANTDPILRDQRQIDSGHLKVLEVFYYITSGLSLAGLLLLFLHYKFMSMIFTSTNFPSNPPGGLANPFRVFIWFYLVLGALGLLAGAMNFFTARSLSRRKHRSFIFVAAILNCLNLPFGTVLGVITIILLMKDTVIIQFTENDGTNLAPLETPSSETNSDSD